MQASGFSTQVPQDGYLFLEKGTAERGATLAYTPLSFLTPPPLATAMGCLLPFLGLRNQSGSCKLVLKQQVAKARRFQKAFRSESSLMLAMRECKLHLN